MSFVIANRFDNVTKKLFSFSSELFPQKVSRSHFKGQLTDFDIAIDREIGMETCWCSGIIDAVTVA